MMTRTAALLAPAALLVGASAPLPPPAGIMTLPSYDQPAQRWASVDEASAELACEQRIHQAREAAGQPRLERAPADAARPILQYAVDRSVDGCAVLVPVGDPGAIEPMPRVVPGRPVVIPAR